MTAAAIALVALLAQETQPAAWSGHRRIADAASTAAVAANVGAELVAAWRAPHRGQALRCEALRHGILLAATEGTKALVHRTRPDGSDRKSFYSEHTALAVLDSGWKLELSIPIALGAGYGRAAAGKHYTSDILVGAAAGLLAGRICRPEPNP
jgi:membrane-associated phospholipid phosphatase